MATNTNIPNVATLPDAATALELIGHVDAFYNHAWGMLAAFTAVVAGIFAFVVPMVINRVQRQQIKISKDESPRVSWRPFGLS